MSSAEKPPNAWPVPPPREFGPEAFQALFDVLRETIERLSSYHRLLQKWQRIINLVSNSTLNAVWWRHFADSAQLVRHLDERATSFVDLGSGAGFPGLIIKAIRPDLGAHLVEADTRKCAFLRTVAAEWGLDVTIHAQRIEEVARQTSRPAARVITARALAPLPKLLDLVAGWADEESQLLLLKGQNVESELISAAKCWTMKVQQIPSLTHPDARLLSIERLIPSGKPCAEV